MKSFFSLVFALLVFISVFGVGGMLWYLSRTSEFSRKDPPAPAGAPAQATPPPGATPAAPSAPAAGPR